MQTYIAFLRGINVSGQKLIKMADLRKRLTEFNFQNIQTYIQSGNIVFQTSMQVDEIGLLIAEKIKEKYGFEVPVLIKTKEDLLEMHLKNPFLKDKNAEVQFLYATMLNNEPDVEAEALLRDYITQSEQFSVIGKEVYLFVPCGYGKTKLNNTLIEKKLGLSATTRNWKTMTKLLEMANA